LNSTPLDVLHGLVKLRLFAAKVPGAPLMGILFGTAICWIEGFCRGPEHSVFGYPFGTDGDRWDMGLRWVEVVSARISCPTGDSNLYGNDIHKGGKWVIPTP